MIFVNDKKEISEDSFDILFREEISLLEESVDESFILLESKFTELLKKAGKKLFVQSETGFDSRSTKAAIALDKLRNMFFDRCEKSIAFLEKQLPAAKDEKQKNSILKRINRIKKLKEKSQKTTSRISLISMCITLALILLGTATYFAAGVASITILSSLGLVATTNPAVMLLTFLLHVGLTMFFTKVIDKILGYLAAHALKPTGKYAMKGVVPERAIPPQYRR